MEAPIFSLPLEASPPDWLMLLAASMPPGEKVRVAGHIERLEDHLRALEKEFAGDSKLDYYHAALIVLIRRNVQRPLAYEQFESMWRDQTDYLCNLNLRWLISACDTIMQHSSNMADRTAGAMGSVLANTVKLYETERHFSDVDFAPKSDLRCPVPLFDGLTTFSIGNGDMIFNQRRRIAELCSAGSFAHRIVLAIIARLDRHDTVYRRFADLHTEDDTRW